MKNIIRELEKQLASKVGAYHYLIIPGLLLAVALTSRLYNLANFPYFTNGWPMCGGFSCLGRSIQNPSLSGLYSDEVTDLLAAHPLSGIPLRIGSGPVALLLIALSTHVFGVTSFAVRFPFALVSGITSVPLYFTAKLIAKSKTLAALSTLYFIVMMPALIYGRMAFAENIVALLFILVFYSTLKIRESVLSGEQSSNRGWFLFASLCSILSILVKINGIIVFLFFVLFLFRVKLLRQGFRYIVFIFGLGILPELAVVQLFTGHSIASFISALSANWIAPLGNSLNLPKFFLFDTLPSSGAPLFWGISGYPIPEFWYIFSYITLVTIVTYDYLSHSSEYSDSNLLLLAIAGFAAFFIIFSEPFGAYWMIMILPLLAISFGPGLKHLLLEMPLGIALSFYAFLFVPLAISLGMTLYTPTLLGDHTITNNILLLWNVLVVVPPAVVLFFTAKVNIKDSKWRIFSNGILLLAFFLVLILATFFVPDLYPYYI